MIKVKYINSEGTKVEFVIHQRIITHYHLHPGGLIEIFFRSTPDVKPTKKSVTYEWSFKSAVSSITNYDMVISFLKSLSLSPKQNTQTLFDF